MQCILVCTISYLISEVQSDCKIIINEVNIVDPKKPEMNEFIELKQICENENENEASSLKCYKLVGFTCKSLTGSIDLVITLWNFRLNSNGIFTVGGPAVTNADVKIPNEMVKFRSGFSKNVPSMANFLINTNNEIHDIGLLYDKLNSFKEFVLTQKQQYIAINERIAEILNKYLVDLVVYGEKVPCSKCELIEKIHSDFTTKKYMLRELQTNSKGKDISLNRCSIESVGFLPEKFKLGNPSPGSPNDCSGPNFILEDHIAEFQVNQLENIEDEYVYDDSCASQPECTSSIPKSAYSEALSQSVLRSLDILNVSSTSNMCTNLMLSPETSSSVIDQENRRKRSIGGDKDYSEEHEWKTEKYFR